ncbi:hypothetical protein FKW77_010015 [Venturia effusa]|uniref:PWI domain-containing protein n=1 Tax=Venturia effusa TaxID=50376 RepID=A0A517KXH8_9PEZI|nr:hypothetical protein FKW77_010015 [Venturia effusa]
MPPKFVGAGVRMSSTPQVYDIGNRDMELDPSEKKILKNTVFPPDFNKKIDIKKVNVEVIRQWYHARCAEMMGDDDIAPEFGWQILTQGSNSPNIKHFQIKMLGFLDKKAAKFSKELWALFLSAQENSNGVPPQLLEAKKEELLKQREEREKRENDNRARQIHEREREQDTDRRRRGGREERGRGRGGYRGDDRRSSYGGRNDRGFEGSHGYDGRRDARDDRANYRDMDPTRRGRDGFRAEGGRRRSLPRYSDRRSRSPPRIMDSYKPTSRRARSPSPRRRSRSHSRSRSRSRNNRRYRSRSPLRSNRNRRRQSSSSRLSATPLRSMSPPRSASRALTNSRPNSSSGPTPADSRPGSAGSLMSTTSSKLSDKGKQKLAEFAREKAARRASASA